MKLMAIHLEALHYYPLMGGGYDRKQHLMMGLQQELEVHQLSADQIAEVAVKEQHVVHKPEML